MDKKESSIISDFFYAFIDVFLCLIEGLKFICLDMWTGLFSKKKNNLQNEQVNISTTNEPVNDRQEAIKLYEQTRSKAKKIKVKHHSAAELKKFEEMKAKLQADLTAAGAVRNEKPLIYEYTVMDKNGIVFSDIMTGHSKLDINSYLLNEGYEVLSIENNNMVNFKYGDSGVLQKKISTKNLVFTLTQLSTYIKAGISLSQAVSILQKQFGKNKELSRVFQAICYQLTLGSSFSDALASQGNFFPPLLINMMKAAEAAGTLQETLDDMANYYNDVNKTKKEMVSAITYPAFITIFALAVLTFIIIYVVPQFTKIYEQSNLEIKGITKVIVDISSYLQDNIFTLVGIILLSMFGLYLMYRKLKAFRVPVQMLLMRIPVIKNVIIYNEITIFSKTFASLLNNNVFITDSVDILSKITTNEIYKAIMFKTIDNIENGNKISEAFQGHWAVPDVAYQMIVTGESTGQLGEMMSKVADYYQQEHKNVVNSLKSFIEPIMIIFLAVMVGIIIIAVIVPMFNMYSEIM